MDFLLEKKKIIESDYDQKYIDYLRLDSAGDLLDLCVPEDKNIFIHKYNIKSTFELLGKCMQMYEKEDIQSYRLKLVNHFFDIKEKKKIFYYISEKISILFPKFYNFENPNIFQKEKINISNNLLADFLRNENYENLDSIPYISGKYIKLLKKNGINNSMDLISKYLELQNSPNNLYIYLKEIGIHNNVHNIIYCICEKCNIIIPGTFIV